jgi:hypothetical protein
MSKGLRTVWAVLFALAVTALAACGSSGGSGSPFAPDGGPDATRHDGGKRDGPSSGGDAHALPPGNDASTTAGTLSISPASVTLTVTSATTPPTKTFEAMLDKSGSSKSVTATWSLSDYSFGAISGAGTFTPHGFVGGTVTVTATYGVLTATANVTVKIDLSSSLTNVTLPDGTVISEDSSAITPANLKALQGTPSSGDAGTPTTIIYPYDQTVFPLGLLAPVAQFSAGSVAPVDFKISLDTTDFHWDGFGHVGNPAALQAAIPQTMWDGALRSAASITPSATVTLSIVKAAAGVAYGPAQSTLIIANGQLTGVIYFESYSTDPIDGGAGAPDATDFGLWAVKPGQTQPPSHLQQGCVICHGVSASGNTLTSGTDDPTIGQSTGVYRVEADGGYTHLATAPTDLPYTISGAVDSRGIGWGTVSPDGKVLLRALNQFWGGETLLAWAVPNEPLIEAGVVQPLSTTMTVEGDFNMFVPEYSVDGNHLVYVTATNTDDAGAPGAPSQSIGFVDIATALLDGGTEAGYGSVTLSNPRTLYDSTEVDAGDGGGAGAYTKVPTVLPDSKSIVFEETLTGAAAAGYDGMLPDYTGVDGELAILQKTAAGKYVRVALKHANTGVDPSAPTHNYEPKPLPVSVGGYYWVVFTSLRADAYPTLASPKKLWVTAISPGVTSGKDPSHPPFTLINQAIVSQQQSQRAYWALAPCLGVGASCQTNNDCCNGSCIPQSSTDPTSPLVCRAPTTTTCVALGGRCPAGQTNDCCNASSGVECLGTLNGYGACAQPGSPH